MISIGRKLGPQTREPTQSKALKPNQKTAEKMSTKEGELKQNTYSTYTALFVLF